MRARYMAIFQCLMVFFIRILFHRRFRPYLPEIAMDTSAMLLSGLPFPLDFPIEDHQIYRTEYGFGFVLLLLALLMLQQFQVPVHFEEIQYKQRKVVTMNRNKAIKMAVMKRWFDCKDLAISNISQILPRPVWC